MADLDLTDAGRATAPGRRTGRPSDTNIYCGSCNKSHRMLFGNVYAETVTRPRRFDGVVVDFAVARPGDYEAFFYDSVARRANYQHRTIVGLREPVGEASQRARPASWARVHHLRSAVGAL